jgi:hypothetical protein
MTEKTNPQIYLPLCLMSHSFLSFFLQIKKTSNPRKREEEIEEIGEKKLAATGQRSKD